MGTCSCTSSSTSTCRTCGRYQISWNDVRFKPNWVNSDNVPQTAKISITSAEVLSLNTAPKLLIGSFGPNNIIDVVSVKIKNNSGSTAYTSSDGFEVRYVGVSTPLLECDQAFVESSSDNIIQMIPYLGVLDDNVSADAGLELLCPNANPTLGDGTFDVYVTFRTITL